MRRNHVNAKAAKTAKEESFEKTLCALCDLCVQRDSFTSSLGLPGAPHLAALKGCATGAAQYLSRVRGCGQLPEAALHDVYGMLTGEVRARSRRPARNTTRPDCGRTCRASRRLRFADRSTTG